MPSLSGLFRLIGVEVPATSLTLMSLLTLLAIGSALWTAVVQQPAELSVFIVLTTLVAYGWHWEMRTGKI
tara:strand:- start:2295 stop:2504 length:210 start_codon:yes stop_codon:yes gene_type:complete